MARSPQLTVDPAGDAASLLRRIGFLILMFGIPLGALASRTAIVFVFAIGIAVMSAASVFGGVARSPRESVGRLVAAPAFLAMVVVAGWAILSLAWTPALKPAGSATLSLLGVVALGAIGYFALPERMRSANLYPMPVGVGIAALVSIALVLGGSGEAQVDVARRMERGLTVLVLYAWPAIAWLRSRGRDIEGAALAVAAAGAAALGPNPVPVIAFAAGALAFFVVQVSGRRGAAAVGIALALVTLAAPLVLLPTPSGAWRAGSAAGWWADLDVWRRAMLAEPVRVLTGHGIGSAGAAAGGAGLPAIFGAPLLGLWYELGIVGAVGMAVALWATLRGASVSFGPLLPGLGAALVTAAVLGLAGIDGGALWWPVALATVALMFVAAERGQFRTRRPRALAIGRSRTA